IAAAGNSGTLRGKGNNVIYPAAYDSVVAVAATDSDDNRAYFSSTGPEVELAAPGYQVYSTVPGGYASYSGTSMACPHVAGVAALMIQAGGLDHQTTRDLLTLSAKDLGPIGHDNMFGYGLVDVPMALQLLGEGGDPPPPPPVEDLAISVSRIEYSLAGGKNSNKDLIISVTIEESVSQLPVSNASVSIVGYFEGSSFGSATGTTNSSGVVSFRVRNASSGNYQTDVTSVIADGYLWDGETPPNNFDKP
ncbi:MAG TPA: S8 family serine peptidase, partial [Planctomycetaceae bacterium]|nr:S8 family serine peptidase [Planctomycetaceae bacterium]